MLDKLGIERSAAVDAMVEDYTKKGVNFATVAARKHLDEKGSKMAPDDKRAAALKVVMDELKKHGITNVGEELITKRIEAFLEQDGHKPGENKNPPVVDKVS